MHGAGEAFSSDARFACNGRLGYSSRAYCGGSMSLRIRALRIVATTPSGQFGVDLSFAQGLNVLRAGNSAGKSTCLNAIIYALGLEGMWGSSRRVPLPHALTQQLEYDGRQVPILESSVLLEVENATDEVLTLGRSIKGERERNLVTVWNGKVLTGQHSPAEPSSDYYVRESGAAVLPSGLHHMLANFVGWALPSVDLGPVCRQFCARVRRLLTLVPFVGSSALE